MRLKFDSNSKDNDKVNNIPLDAQINVLLQTLKNVFDEGTIK